MGPAHQIRPGLPFYEEIVDRSGIQFLRRREIDLFPGSDFRLIAREQPTFREAVHEWHG